MARYYKSFEEINRYSNELAKIKVKCACSHTMIFPSFGPDIKVCSHCGKLVYRNEKIKFKSLLSKKLELRC